MIYQYRASRRFWKAFDRLEESQKRSAQKAWEIFKVNPFDSRLRAHKIHRLSAEYKVTIHAIEIEGDLRALFYLDGNIVWSVDIGSHAIYRR